MYPKNIKFLSTNPLDSSFLYSNLSTVDQVAKVFETFVKDNVMDKDIKLYIYLRVFFIKKIAIVTGSGMSLIDEIKADCFLTGDIKYHEAMEAKARGLSLIDIRHYES